MAAVQNNVFYQEANEVKLAEIKAGNVVLVKDPQGRVAVYMVNKIGTTPIKNLDPTKQIVLTNLLTGRIVLKWERIPCVLVQGEITLSELI